MSIGDLSTAELRRMHKATREAVGQAGVETSIFLREILLRKVPGGLAMPATKRSPGRPRKHFVEVEGILRPDSIYTVEGVLRAAGIGRETLSEARRSGIVKPIEIGKRVYYRGEQLIAWIESQASSVDA